MESVFNTGLSTFAKVASEVSAVDYPRFAELMDVHGYDWEAFKVHTDDQYILTTFHILGKTGEARPTESKGSVLC